MFVTEFVLALIRGVFMLLAGALVLLVAGVLLLCTLAFVLVASVWGLLNGRKPSASASWSRFQQSAATAMWQRYRAKAQAGRGAAAEPAARNATDVVDVDFREVPSGPAPQLKHHAKP